MFSQFFSLRQIKVLILLFSLLIGQGVAGEISTFIDNKTKQVFTELNSNLKVYKTDRKRLRTYLSKTLNEVFHFPYMAQYVAGKYWRTMDKTQRKEYVKQFKYLLLNAYGAIILGYRYEDLTFFPEVPARKKKQFWVKVLANRNNNPFSINYQVAVTKKGPRIINIKAEGISLLINYRKSFAEIFSSKGATTLIKMLQEKNDAS